MATEQHILLVDAGNSAVKYARLDDPDVVFSATTPAALFEALKNQAQVTAIYLSNVGSVTIEQQFSDYCSRLNIPLRVIETEKKRFDLQNSYSKVEKMGVDRWLAMLAGQTITSKPFAVIDIGTAITCDFVVNGQHLGGWITPGYTLMRDALVKNTARVTAHSHFPDNFGVGQDTEECVAFGCMAAVRGVYLSALDYLSSNQTDFSVIVGGGGKNMLAFAQFDGSILVANLVVLGLARYAKSEILASGSES